LELLSPQQGFPQVPQHWPRHLVGELGGEAGDKELACLQLGSFSHTGWKGWSLIGWLSLSHAQELVHKLGCQ
jgi:hypothetical protein